MHGSTLIFRSRFFQILILNADRRPCFRIPASLHRPFPMAGPGRECPSCFLTRRLRNGLHPAHTQKGSQLLPFSLDTAARGYSFLHRLCFYACYTSTKKPPLSIPFFRPRGTPSGAKMPAAQPVIHGLLSRYSNHIIRLGKSLFIMFQNDVLDAFPC